MYLPIASITFYFRLPLTSRMFWLNQDLRKYSNLLDCYKVFSLDLHTYDIDTESELHLQQNYIIACFLFLTQISATFNTKPVTATSKEHKPFLKVLSSQGCPSRKNAFGDVMSVI